MPRNSINTVALGPTPPLTRTGSARRTSKSKSSGIISAGRRMLLGPPWTACRDPPRDAEAVERFFRLNQATQHWHTGSTRKRAIAVRPGHRVYESHVDRFRARHTPYDHTVGDHRGKERGIFPALA